ncbi:MAG: MFS transporter [Planctomycetaceae bacterium]|nr:MFS transporter [Planctomycetaceae bacterium]
MDTNRWRNILLLMVYAGMGHFNRVGISVAGDELFIPEKGISEVQMGWVYTTFLIVYTIGMLPGGWLIDRFGSSRVLGWFGLGMGTFVVLTGALGWISTTATTLLIGLLVIRGLAGVCNAPLHPGAAHVVSVVITPPRQATANGMITAGALVGIACCFPVFGWLIDVLGWQLAFVAGGATLVSCGLLWRVFAEPTLPQLAASDTVGPMGGNEDGRSLSRLLESGNIWLITLSYAAYGYFQYLFFYWMGYYFKDVLQVPDVNARWASFWIMLSMGGGMVLGGRCTDLLCGWLGTAWGRRLMVIGGMGLGAVFGLIGVNVESFASVSIFLALSMAAAGMCEGVFWTTATDIGGRSGGFAGAFMNTGGNIGGLISPVLTPIMAAAIGWPGAIATACVISGVGGLTWLLITPPAAIVEIPAEVA